MTQYINLVFGQSVESMFLYATVLVSFATIYIAYLFFGGPVGKIPGPPLAKLSRVWLVRLSRKGDMHRKMIDLHAKYGTLVRTGPNEVSVSDLNAIKIIYGKTNALVCSGNDFDNSEGYGSKFRRSDWYSVFQGHRKFDLFGERDKRIHSSQRRLVSSIYSMDRLKDLEPSIDNAPIDMGVWAQLFAFDVIGEVTFSKPFGYVAAGKDNGSFSQIDAALGCAAWIGQVPWLYWAHERLVPVIGNRLAIGARHGSLRNIAILQLRKVQKEKPEEMNETAVVSMVTSNIFAGSDTTAITIVALLYYLCKFPVYKQKLLAEIKAVDESIKTGDCIALEVTKQMPYLQACIHEALRCHPAVGMTLPRVTPRGGFEIDGHFIPEGTTVGVNPWVLHRDKKVFGEDADTFRPDRWLVEDTSQMGGYLPTGFS
ncbi:hypothetical protein MMC14_007296 [Varicellaria rhodocarpa]|nr:hypothetical protein [Varicellaria rhodocarpa]